MPEKMKKKLKIMSYTEYESQISLEGLELLIQFNPFNFFLFLILFYGLKLKISTGSQPFCCHEVIKMKNHYLIFRFTK